MKNVLMLALIGLLAFGCKDKEATPAPAPDYGTIAGWFTFNGHSNDSTAQMRATAVDLGFTPHTAVFNGTSSFIRIPAFDSTEQLTVSFFFKAVYDISQEPTLMHIKDENGNDFEIYIRNHRVHLTHWDQTQQKYLLKIATSEAPWMEGWNKVVATIDFPTNAVSLYVNDLLVGTTSNAALTRLSKPTIFLGVHQTVDGTAKDFYSGELDDFRIDTAMLDPATFSAFQRESTREK